MKAKSRNMGAVLACAALAACGGEPTGVQFGSGGDRGAERAGTFEAQVTGLVNGRVEGRAVFGTALDPETGVALWVMNLTPAEGSVGGVHFLRRGSRPVQDAALSEIDDSGVFADTRIGGVFIQAQGINTQAGFFSTSGELGVRESTDERMAGTFRFDAAGFLIRPDGSVEQGEVNVSGTYDALPGSVFVPPTR